MKKNLHRLYFLVLLFSVSFVPQAIQAAAIPELHHVGVGNKYKLGAKENPVIANEYCAFLNSNKRACKIRSSWPTYYDRTFMNRMHEGWWNREVRGHQNINESDCITRYNKYNYRFIVIPGREDYIIEGLASNGDGLDWNRLDDQTPKAIVTEFNAWRKNYTVQNLCDILNDEISGLDKKATMIEACYPEASKEVLNTLHSMAQVVRNNAENCLEIQLSDEQNRPIIKFSNESDEISFPGTTVHAVVVAGMEYYRPSSITKSSEPHYIDLTRS